MPANNLPTSVKDMPIHGTVCGAVPLSHFIGTMKEAVAGLRENKERTPFGVDMTDQCLLASLSALTTLLERHGDCYVRLVLGDNWRVDFLDQPGGVQ